jgi:D-arabinose 1-dehydrogenase-like Zn-dependent alcohol dehydrogenase
MGTMKAMQVSRAGAEFELVIRDIPEPGISQVRVKVEACGICHSDMFAKEGLFPGSTFPRIPGHEAAGVIDKLGEGITTWKVGQRVGVGWYSGHCGVCEQCRRGDFISCQYMAPTGILRDGGYAQYVIVSQDALAAIPEGLSAIEAAPLMCGGITTFNALRNSGARPGDNAAIEGIGGLGHLAVQFARKMGFNTIAISRGKNKKDLAEKLGAHRYIDSEASDCGQELQKMGGARVILATAPSSKSMSALVEGLSTNGTLLIVAAAMEPLMINPITLIRGRRSVRGWPSGTAKDSEDALKFCVLTGVRAMTEIFNLEDAAIAYDSMMAGKVRFRAVLKIDDT